MFAPQVLDWSSTHGELPLAILLMIFVTPRIEVIGCSKVETLCRGLPHLGADICACFLEDQSAKYLFRAIVVAVETWIPGVG